jgi:hypothetical protein
MQKRIVMSERPSLYKNLTKEEGRSHQRALYFSLALLLLFGVAGASIYFGPPNPRKTLASEGYITAAVKQCDLVAIFVKESPFAVSVWDIDDALRDCSRAKKVHLDLTKQKAAADLATGQR